MIESIISEILILIFQVFVEEILFGLLRFIFKMLKKLGYFVLKLIHLNKTSLADIEEKYKDSSLPYFIILGIFIVVIYLIIKY